MSQRYFTAVLLFALASAACGDESAIGIEPACGDNVFTDCWDECCYPLWTFRAGAIFLDRSAPTVGPQFFVSPDPANFAPQLGFDFNARRQLGDCQRLEIRYFGVNDFSAIDDTAVPGLLVARYDSQLQSAELNFLRDSASWWSLIAGFRYVGFDERVTDEVTLAGGAPIFSQDSITSNNLYGFQAGVEGRLLQRGRVSADGYVKAGVYYNDLSVTTLASIFGVPVFADGAGTNHAAFVGETGVTGVYQWTDRIAVRGGVQFLWLEGVGEAGNQGVAGFDPLNTGGSVFYYGGTGAVEIAF